jgi:hypothetical protein
VPQQGRGSFCYSAPIKIEYVTASKSTIKIMVNSTALNMIYTYITIHNAVTDLINALPGNSSVNTVQHATIEEAVFSVDLTDAPIDWLESGHVICVYGRSMSVPRLYTHK